MSVIALTRFNGYAELVVVPAGQVVPLPEGMTFEQGAALPVNYLTAMLMLEDMGHVSRGERVLVHGAAGGVGLAAVQLARIHDAEVIGTASASKHAALRAAGVAHTIDYRTADVEVEIRRLTGGRGVDIVLDPIGGENLRRSYRALAPLGRLVAFGFSASAPGTSRRIPTALWQLIRMPRFSPITLMNDNRVVMGVNLGHLWGETALLRRDLTRLLDYFRAGKINPTVGKTFPLTDAAAAHAYIQGRQNVGMVERPVESLRIDELLDTSFHFPAGYEFGRMDGSTEISAGGLRVQAIADAGTADVFTGIVNETGCYFATAGVLCKA